MSPLRVDSPEERLPSIVTMNSVMPLTAGPQPTRPYFEAGLIAVCLFLGGCSSKNVQSASKGEDAAPVVVASVVQKPVPVDIDVIGNVEAYSTIAVKAQIGGELTHVYFSEGDYVKKGELLFSIDPRPYQGQVNRIEANLAKDRAELNQAEANLARDQAQAEYPRLQEKRYAKLFEEGLFSREQYDQVRSQADALVEVVRADQAAIESARAAIAADEAALSQARIQLNYASISSPIDGRTGNLLVKQGNVVKANDVDLVTIKQIQPVYVTFSVPEFRLPAIRKRMLNDKLPVLASPEDLAAKTEVGTLVFVDNAVDMTTGTIKLKGVFENRSQKLWPGQFVRVALRLTTEANALVVPSQAIQTSQEGQFVFVVKSDMSTEQRPISVGLSLGQETVVEKGLQAGEKVVTEGQLRLAPNTRVQIKKGESGDVTPVKETGP